MAVTVFFTADFTARHFFNQFRCTADHLAQRERQCVDFFLQGFDIGHQFGCGFLHAGYVFFYPKSVFDTVEPGKPDIFRTVFEVVFTRIDDGVEFTEKLGNRFDAFVMDAGGGEQGFRLFNVACFDGFGKGFGFRHQLFNLALNVGFIVGERLGQFFQIRFVGSAFKAAVGYHQLAARIGQKAASHFIFARQQGYGHFVGKPRGDVFALIHHHHALQDFPFELAAAVVFNVEHNLSARYGQIHRFAGIVVDGDTDRTAFVGGLGLTGRGRRGFLRFRRLASSQT